MKVKTKSITTKGTFFYGLRLLMNLLVMEIMQHTVYATAISKHRVWESYTPLQISLVGFFCLFFIWMKVTFMVIDVG
jgi:D-alanyl-lipoteichoic acid acyltransferase DltB (MBOAT superfamily)